MPPPPPPLSPSQSGDPLGLEELRRAYNVYHGMLPHDPVGALRRHFQGTYLNWRFAVALLPHGATNICLRQLQALLSRGQHTPDDLINVSIWRFNHHQPDKERIWVPHLACAHKVIAPPTEPQPAERPGVEKEPRRSSAPMPSTSDHTMAQRPGKAGQAERRGTTFGQRWSGTRNCRGRRHTRSPRGASPAAPSPWWCWRTATTTS